MRGRKGTEMATENVKKDVLRRAKIAEGHLKKVIRMIEDNEYCVDIINQSVAVENALKKIDEILLEDHMKTCVVHQIHQGKTTEVAKEVMEIFKRRG